MTLQAGDVIAQEIELAGDVVPAVRPRPLRIVFGRFEQPSEGLAAAWDALAAAAAEPNIFSERWFVMAAIHHLPLGSTAHRLEIWDGEGADARLVALLALASSRRYGRFPVRHVTNWRHYQSFLGTPLIVAGREREAWSAILDALGRLPWACNFLHIDGLVENGPVHRGLITAARAIGRTCDTVHRIERALLESALTPTAYYERTVRKKKRKELKRLATRLGELGAVRTRRLGPADALLDWIDVFLTLEQSGWKGKGGAALANMPDTEAFFREAVAGAHAAGRLEMLRLDLDDRPIAMLVNFLAPPGSFSFKIAFDEDYARFSPGVLVQIENYRILDRPDIAWMDSCAVENHPMINSLWAERRAIVRVTTPLGAGRGTALFHLCRSAERVAAAARRIRSRLAASSYSPVEAGDDR
ncbi:GNAT family N-acetyltransferase [Flavisphingomonas formosensis]|uniref:GNAT family N-acetyltransferase n=1 Tax=Flavisphingomonas formosensis TaxID=861534 RepID=UPI0012FA3272|nr:GNAT family N-acetyltransferase [Sphingomonas formosensis]